MKDCSPLDALSDILMGVPDMVFAFSLDGRYLFVNAKAAEFLGADPVQVIGYHWRDLGYPEEVMEPLMARVAESGKTCESSTFRLRTTELRGGLMLDLSITPLMCEAGEVLGVLVIARDISEFF